MTLRSQLFKDDPVVHGQWSCCPALPSLPPFALPPSLFPLRSLPSALCPLLLAFAPVVDASRREHIGKVYEGFCC
jgi:hypothetical protein